VYSKILETLKLSEDSKFLESLLLYFTKMITRFSF